jgi:hypothetical protein
VLSWLEGGNWRGSHLEDALSRAGTPLFLDQYGEFRLRLFGRSGDSAPANLLGERTETFASVIRLVDYKRHSREALAPGKSFDVSLTWQCLAPPDGDKTVFVQLVGPDGRLYGQKDNPPVKGAHLTSAWKAGEVVIDRYALAVAKDAPAGEYRLIAGLYNPTTGKRLPVAESDHVVLERLTLESR